MVIRSGEVGGGDKRHPATPALNWKLAISKMKSVNHDVKILKQKKVTRTS